MKSTCYFSIFLFVLIAGIVCNDQSFAQSPQNNANKADDKTAKQEDKDNKKAEPKEVATKKKAIKKPKPYTPQELTNGVLSVVRKTAISSAPGNSWIYLENSSRSIAEYLYYIQLAQGERLLEDQIMTRLKVLALDAGEMSLTWRSKGIETEDGINRTVVKTDQIFTIARRRMFSGVSPDTETEKLKKLRELEEKAFSLYKEAQLTGGR